MATLTDKVTWIGRNWEGFAADPYADGILGAQSIRGLQESVIASVKHFVANVSLYGMTCFIAWTHADVIVLRNKRQIEILSPTARHSAVLPT